MSTIRSLALIRQTRVIPRQALPARRVHPLRASFTTSLRVHNEDRPKAAHPAKNEARPVSSGEPVAEFAKQDERKISGVKEEPLDGPPEPPLAGLSALDLFTLKSQTVIVSGGGRGLGLTIAQAALQAGASVACLDLLPQPTQPQWSKAEDYAKSKGLSITYHSMDITDPVAVSAKFASLFEQQADSQPIRSMFIAAGIQIMGPAVDFSHDKFQKIMNVNLTGSFLCAQAFAKEWMARNPQADGSAGGRGASIAMTGSMSGHIANFGLEILPYCASKAAVNQMAKNMALEWSHKGIRVNTLSPGYIRTALTAAQLDEKPELAETWLKGSLLGRLSTPDEFRGPVLFLLSEASSYMTGADLLVDGGHCAT
ncbi:hypothetical protein IAU60_000410 [Kwoniella sp. DSM 27419]